MVSKKRKYIETLEDIIESQRVVIHSLTDKNDKLLKNLNLALTHPYINNQYQQIQQQIQQQQMKLYENMSLYEYLKFGLINTYGERIAETILKYMNTNLYFYFKDKSHIYNLLITVGSSENRTEYFINWLIENKKYVKNPVGFLLSCEDT